MAVELRQIQRHLQNIERELAALKKLLATASEEQRRPGDEEGEILKKQLHREGFTPDLLQLVGTAPIRRSDYKADLQTVISARHARKR